MGVCSVEYGRYMSTLPGIKLFHSGIKLSGIKLVHIGKKCVVQCSV